MRKVSGDLADGGKYTESFGLSTLSTDNMRKVSSDLADGGDGGEYADLSNKIVMPTILWRGQSEKDALKYKKLPRKGW
jgi:hypothetical protein